MSQDHVIRVYNCRKSSIDHRDYLLKLNPNDKTLKTVSTTDLRTNCPDIYDQGQLGSCVANGVSFNMHINQIKSNNEHQFTPSRLFIYYNTRVIENSVNEDSGTTIRDALVSVSNSGACPETIWPYIISQFAVKPSDEAYASGAQHLVKVYTRVLLDLAQMKQCINDGYPFIFGIMLYTSFNSVGPNGIVPVPSNSDPLLGGHCMACVGYDDTRQVFIVRNSWGTSWGDRGYCYIPYNYLTDAYNVFDLWTIRMVSDTENNVTFGNILSVTYGKNNRIIDVTTIFNNHFNSRTQLYVENSLFTDPYPGVIKELRINFYNNTNMVFTEHSLVTRTQIDNMSNIVDVNTILTAMYGKGSTYINVTNILKDKFSQGYLQIKVSNQLFTDPLYRVFKELKIHYTNGVTRVYPENCNLTLDEITNPNASVNNIVSARYGKGSTYVDVTTVLKNYFNQGHTQAKVSNTLFTDPLYGVFKELRLLLTTNVTKVFMENSYVALNDCLLGK